MTSGIGYSDIINDIVNNFESKKEYVKSKLKNVFNSLCAKSNLTFGFTGTKDEYLSVKDIIFKYTSNLNDNPSFKKDTEFKVEKLNEAFTAPIDVNYVARIGNFKEEFHGGLNVLQNAMSLDYLWMQVRVHGGAYGCNLAVNPNGSIGFASYRDPNIIKTNEVYEAASKFVREFNPSNEDLVKFKIGAIGNSESVLHNREKAEAARVSYLRGQSFEDRCKVREEMLTVTKEEIQGFAKLFDEALDYNVVSCIGNPAKVEEAKGLFKSVRQLNK